MTKSLTILDVLREEPMCQEPGCGDPAESQEKFEAVLCSAHFAEALRDYYDELSNDMDRDERD